MPLRQSDILIHNNPNLAVVDSDFIKGGFRTAVDDVSELYQLSGKTDEPSASGQVKEYSTFIYVRNEGKYYHLVDIDNIDNASGWDVFISGSGETNVSVVNIGSGVGLYSSKSGTTLQFKSIIGSGDTNVSTSGDSVIIHSIGGSSSGITYASNGLTLEGNVVELGGELDKNTNISGITHDFTINTNKINLQSISGVDITNTDGGDGINIESDGGYIQISSNDNLSVEKFKLVVSNSGATIVDNTINQSGFEYNNNYHSGYTNRSLVDREYVDIKSKIDEVVVVNVDYFLNSGDTYVGVSGATNITLYSNPMIGKRVIISDIIGNAEQNPININGNGNSINDSNNADINTNFGSITILYNGFNWNVIGFVN